MSIPQGRAVGQGGIALPVGDGSFELREELAWMRKSGSIDVEGVVSGAKVLVSPALIEQKGTQHDGLLNENPP